MPPLILLRGAFMHRPLRRQLVVVAIAFAIGAAVLNWEPAAVEIGYADGGLVAAFNFDEGAGTIATDVSGLNNNGVITGATWSTTAKYGKALSFTTNGMVTIADHPSLDLTTAFTLESWVRPTSTAGWRTAVMKEVPGELAYTLYANSDTARPSAWARIGGVSYSAIGPAKLVTNVWTHIATTYDGATLRLYVNGASVASRPLTGTLQTSDLPLRIGGNNIWGEYYRGQIDDVRVYNRGLSAAEIQTDMVTPVSSVDTVPPVVTMTAPAAGATVANTINVSANVTDNVTVAGVQFYLDGAVLGSEDTSAPYSVTWDTRTGANGAHTLAATAHDAAGNTASNSVSVTVNNPPRLLILQPPPGASINGTTVNVTYSAQGDVAEVHHVHFVLDAGATLMDLSFDGAYQLSSVPVGAHTLNGYLVRSDHSQIAGSAATPVTFTTFVPDTNPPSISVVQPLDGAALSGATLLRADAGDDIAVAGVLFMLDGVAIGNEDLTPPYEITWDSTLAANGAHTISARARDAAANTSVSAAIAVTIANSGPVETGQWSAPFSIPVIAIHQALLPSGQVLMWDAADFTSAPPILWNPQTDGYANVPATATDLFCVGHAMLANGKLLTVGGDTPTTGLGVNDVNLFDPQTNAWTTMPKMAYRRWYPTATTLSDGRVFVLSGYDDCYGPSCLVGRPEIYNPLTNAWTSLSSSDYVTPSYPFLFEMPDGRIISAGSYEGTVDTRVLDLSTGAWSVLDSNPIDAGSAVIYAPGKIMKAGKWANSDPPYVAAHPNTYVMDLNQPTPQWRTTAPMNFPRAYNMLTLLPDGTTLATAGSRSTDPGNGAQGVLEAEIWSPATETWTTMARMRNPRLYHGTSILLPDGRVIVAGSGRYGSPEEFNAEIFSPPYLFKGPRPVIGSAPPLVHPGRTFAIDTTATNVSAVTMLRIGSMTHSFNSDQRFLSLPFTAEPGRIVAQAPANVHDVMPGYYLLFLVNEAGVPSVGVFVRVPATTEDHEAPTAPADLSALGGLGQAVLSWTAASDNVAVAHYRVHRSAIAGFTPGDTNLVGTTTTTGFLDTGAAGSYYYRVVARDAAGNDSAASNEAAAAITADTTAPSVAITAPTSGASVSGVITVSATALDNVGVAGVRFQLDGGALGAEDTGAPYSVSWNSATATAGAHQLTAIARDGAGNHRTSDPVPVTVVLPAPAGLVAALGFDEGAGTATSDASGLGNHGTLANTSWTPSGKFGSALMFNGTSSWVTVADTNSLDLTVGMTLSAWVRPTSVTSDYRTIMLKERAPGLGYALYATDGASRPPAGYLNTGASDVAVVAASNLALNTWTHVAVTYDGAAMRIYVNGALVRTTNTTGAIRTSTGAFRIGGNSVWGEYFAGTIDEVRVYNRALSASDIQSDMTRAVTTPATP